MEYKKGRLLVKLKRTLTSADIVQPESTSDCTSEFQSFIESIRKIEKKRREEKYNFTFSSRVLRFRDGRLGYWLGSTRAYKISKPLS